MNRPCFDCEVKKQREKFKQVINQARDIAKQENRTVTIYRTESGELTLEDTGTPERFITQNM